MNHVKAFLFFSFLLAVQACDTGKNRFDASGTFEADEVIVSSELAGRLDSLVIQEGDSVYKGQVVGSIDAGNLALQKEQVEASIRSLSQKTANVQPQVLLLQNQLAVLASQLENLQQEKQRTERLVQADAATGKQLDDLNAQLDVVSKQMAVTRQQIQVQKSNVATQNRGILSEKAPLQKQVAQLDERLSKSKIVNPANGIVITQYAEQGEVTAPGKALYNVADLSEMILRAYITGSQLSQVKLGQSVQVYVDKGADDYRRYDGVITWVSDKAEFTPKSIQTKEERANLVFAIKVRVKNDGFLKMGMYGEVKLNP